MGPSRSPSPRTRSSASRANQGANQIVGDDELLSSERVKRLANKLALQKCARALREGQIRIVSPNPFFYIPRADIVDDPESSIILAIFEVPGLKPEEVHVSFKDGSLSVSGIRNPIYQEATPASDIDTHAMDTDSQASTHTRQQRVREIRYGPFHRIIKLPDGTQASQISAKISDGMLKVTWPRSPLPDDSQGEAVKTESESPCLSHRSRSPEKQLPPTKHEAATASPLQ
jgi:HSP20 family protein